MGLREVEWKLENSLSICRGMCKDARLTFSVRMFNGCAVARVINTPQPKNAIKLESGGESRVTQIVGRVHLLGWSKKDDKWFRYIGFKGVFSLPDFLKGIGITTY